MLVRNRMSKKVIGVEPQHSITDARALLHRHHIRQLPVLHGRRLVGIVTDRDLRSPPGAAKIIADIMTGDPVVVAANASVDEAAGILRKHKIGALPVVEGGKMVGIITASDILDAFVDLSGVGEATYRIEISGARGKQAERQVRQVIQDQRGELKWIHPDSRDASKLHLRLRARRIDDIVTCLEAAGFEVDALLAPWRSRG